MKHAQILKGKNSANLKTETIKLINKLFLLNKLNLSPSLNKFVYGKKPILQPNEDDFSSYFPYTGRSKIAKI